MMFRGLFRGWVAGMLWLASLGMGRAQHGPHAPGFAAAAEQAAGFQLQPGLRLDVWAAEPQLSNGVAFAFDGRGRAYIAETHRWNTSIFDITQRTNWLLADMAFRSVADRVEFLEAQFAAVDPDLLTRDSERVRRVEDRDGDGKADHSEVFADGFNTPADGTAAGVLATAGRVFFANIPSLWSLEEKAGPAEAPGRPKVERSALATGFGVHIGVSGHDLHGLIRGPDGRLYFSFGDRGVCLTNREGAVIHLPDTGGVLRCEPDGSNLELFCFGLRNPQELAF
ncbi:MAG: glucose dehydrogenase, partial [Verrucomicrobiota bacterium]